MSEVIVVASSSIDAAGVLARRLAAHGAHVAILAASRRQLPDIARDIVKAGAPTVLAIPCDLTDPDEVFAAAQRVERELGAIDRWINTSLTDLRYVNATRAALGCMQRRDRGTIVQVGAPKSIRVYTEALAGELRLAGSGVHLETVRTYPFRRLGAGLMAAASVVGAILLRRVVR